MSINLVVPELKTGTIVVTPTTALTGITKHKKYVVENITEDHIYLRNDYGEIRPFLAYQFMEADVYFTVCLFSTMITIFEINSKIFK